MSPSRLEDLTALILAGGEGTRLQPVIGPRAKIMAPVGGEPFIHHLLGYLFGQGLVRVVLALGFFHQEVEEYLRGRPPGLDIETVREEQPLGTAGAIRHALEALRGDPVLVMNGDTYCDVPLASMLSFHDSAGAALTIAGAQVSDAARFGTIANDEGGRVTGFLEKASSRAGCVNSGVYLISRNSIEEIPAGRAVSLEREILPSLVGRGLFVYKGTFRFLDIGTPDSYREAGRRLGKA